MAAVSLPSKITAVGIAKNGEIDVIQNLGLPFPSAKPNQLVIKVEYAGVNFIDTQQRQGHYPLPPLPTALGVEGAGTIIALPTDENVLNNEAFRARGFKVGGKIACFGIGMFAEYAVVDWSTVVSLPPTVSARDGAASTAQGLTAVAFVSEAYDVQAGDYILVHTVAGGLGLWFAQLCRYRGATVIGTTSTKEKAEVAKAHGADHVILYRDEDVVARVMEITNGEGVHAIFDGVGKDTFEGNLKAIRPKGTIVTLGTASGPIEAFNPRVLAEKNIKYIYPSAEVYLGHPSNGKEYYQELVGLLASGAVKPVISKEYPFTAEGVAQSQKDLAESRSVGKLLVKIASD